MTVAELIAKLQDMPQDEEVLYKTINSFLVRLDGDVKRRDVRLFREGETVFEKAVVIS